MLSTLSSLTDLLASYANTSSKDAIEMFCAVSPVASFMSPPIQECHTEPSVDHSDCAVSHIQIDVEGPDIDGYVLGSDNEFLIVECVRDSDTNTQYSGGYYRELYIPLYCVKGGGE